MRVLTLFEVPVLTVFETDFPFRFPRAVVESGNGSRIETGGRSGLDERGIYGSDWTMVLRNWRHRGITY
jgi:hypothetical protein